MREECEMPAGPAGDPSSCTGTLLLGLLVPGDRGVLERLQMSWLSQPAQHFLVCRDRRVPSHVWSLCCLLLIADEFLPDKRNSYLPIFHVLLLFIAHLKSCWPSCPSKSSQLCSCRSGERDGVRMGSVDGS